MSLINRLAQYKQIKSGITHCTFNPSGPGVVRIHLIPPKFKLLKSSPYIVILNGYYLLPIGYSWAVLLASFMNEVNKFDCKPIGADENELIVKNTIKKVRSIYPTVSKNALENDLDDILTILFTIAQGKTPDTEIEKLSIRAYAHNMTAPHRMDLMVSAMTDSKGIWKCNQKCKFCYAAGQKKSSAEELSTNDWKQILDKLYKANIPMVTFTGGEPTLRSDLTELVEYAKLFVTRLNTNGVLLTDKLCEELKNAGLDSVQVTLYSHDEKIHNTLVGSEHFSDTVSGIKNAVDKGLDISINTPLCKLNRDYTKTLEFINSLGVRFVTVSGLICTGTAEATHDEFDLSSDELSAIVKQAKEYCDANEMEIDFTSPGLIKNEYLESLNMNVPMCGAGLSNMAIAPDGAVIPCQSWLDSNAELGSILTTDFKNIWNNPKCVKLRSMTETEATDCPFRKQGGKSNE